MATAFKGVGLALVSRNQVVRLAPRTKVARNSFDLALDLRLRSECGTLSLVTVLPLEGQDPFEFATRAD